MKRAATLKEGARAAEQLAAMLTKLTVRKALDPMTDEGYLLICEAIAQALSTATKGAEQAAITAALDALDIDWDSLEDNALEAAFAAVELAIAEVYANSLIPKVSAELAGQGANIMRATRLALIGLQFLSIEPSLQLRDLEAEKFLRTSQLNFIRYSSGQRAVGASQRARDVVAAGLKDGLGTDVIAKDLKAAMSEEIPRPDSYWRLIADTYVNRARTTSAVYALDDAGIEAYEIVAVLDEVTTDICRFMDGKIFRVRDAVGLIDRMSGLQNPEDIKYEQPWIRKGRDANGDSSLYVPQADGSRVTIAKIERSGVGSQDDRGQYSGDLDTARLAQLGCPVPPFHGRCRSTIVAADG